MIARRSLANPTVDRRPRTRPRPLGRPTHGLCLVCAGEQRPEHTLEPEREGRLRLRSVHGADRGREINGACQFPHRVSRLREVPVPKPGHLVRQPLTETQEGALRGQWRTDA